MTFRSKVDTWLLLVLLIGALVALVGSAFSLQSGAGWVLSTLIGLVGAALPLWILTCTKYTVTQGQLLVQSGPFRWRIPALDITQITPTHSPLSSPALSLDRLRIEYAGGKKSLLVSPAEPREFLSAIQAAKSAA